VRLYERLDRLPIGTFHWRLLGLCGAGWVLDSVDTGLVGFVIADLIQRWSLSKEVAGSVVSCGMAGLFAGSILAGILADRWGRRPIFLSTLALFSVGSLLCGLAWNVVSLAVLRFLLGVALGGEFPVGTALMAEYLPTRHRGRMMVLLDSFWGYGSVLAALIAYALIPRFGWRAAFLANVLPAAAVALARRSVPESPRYLVLHGRAEEARVTVERLETQAGLAVGDGVEEPAHPRPRPHLKEILARPILFNTVRLWVMWFSMTFVYVGLSSWLPSLLVEAGYDLRRSFRFMLLISAAQIPGYLTAALVIEHWGRRWSLSAFTLGAGVCSLLFAHSRTAADILLWGCLMAYFNMASWGIFYAYSGEQFSTRLRAFGNGSCTAIGRFGGIVSPVAVGALLQVPALGRPAVLTVFGLLLFLTSFAVWLGRETRGQSLEALHGS